MSAKHALLGLLLERPAYPYELANRLQERLGPAWRINSGQLSQAIKAMEREGLIEPVVGSPEDRDRRRVVAITEEGEQELERWFGEMAGDIRLSRRPLLVKMTLAGPERLRDALAQIDAYERDCAARVQKLSRERDEIFVGGELVRADRVLLRLSLSANIDELNVELGWARHARDALLWLLHHDAVWPSGREALRRRSDEARSGARRELFGGMAARDAPGAGDVER